MTRADATIVEIQAKVIRPGARPEAFGWSVTIPPGDAPEKIAAAVTDACRRVRDETQGKLRL